MKFVLLSLFLIVGCVSSHEEEPFTCDPSEDRAGTYFMHFEERRGGTCGPTPDQLVRLGNDSGSGGDCESTAPDVWSNDRCRVERSFVCFDAGGFIIEGIFVSDQEDERGEVLTGTHSVTIRDEYGNFLCTSTYDVTATRQ